ncbi:phosphotransferase [Georgenia sp. H159]|uniref:phosphotransferase n=1 Tax=Georgenia sp. H159 TaxID=3076115 RepID=UPI002D76F1F9|nr:phosphotransferase [Georgenia sp. H159]
MTRRSPLALAALATAAVPGLDVVATRSPQSTTADFQVTGVLDSGGRQWVVRSPLHASAGASLEAEVELLANLAPHVRSGALPFAVPEPAGFAPLPEGGRAMVYRQLRGRPLDLERLGPGPGLAADLGRCLAALHELPTGVVEDAGLPSYDADEYRRRCLAEVDAAARTGHVPTVVLQRWEQALEDVALWRFRTTPVHGDLAEEHVLVLDGEVSAVISFSEAHVGDPAVDLAWLLASAPEDCLDAIEEAYALARPENADGHLLDRAQLVGELALARWLMHGVNTSNDDVVADAVHMLTDLADQVRDAEPIGHREPVVVPGRGEDWEDGHDAGPGDEPDDPSATVELPALSADEPATDEEPLDQERVDPELVDQEPADEPAEPATDHGEPAADEKAAGEPGTDHDEPTRGRPRTSS